VLIGTTITFVVGTISSYTHPQPVTPRTIA